MKDAMQQAITGVTPAELAEAHVTTVWPSICMYRSGCFLGRWFSVRWPDVYIFRFGHLVALAAIPHAVALYFWRLLPRVGTCYRLTNRRIVVQRGFCGGDGESLPWDGFDAIEVDVRPGQAWFQAGDLVFRQQGVERFRLAGVPRPEVVRQTCLKSRLAYVAVQEVREQQRRSA